MSCKRSSGAGFTRYENLNEHLRRCHSRPEMEVPEPSAVEMSTAFDYRPAKRRRSRGSSVLDEEVSRSPPLGKPPSDVDRQTSQEGLLALVDRLTQDLEVMKRELRAQGDAIERLSTRREQAWRIFQYPCIGLFHFLDLAITVSPAYPAIISHLKDAPSQDEDPNAGPFLLDLGCCFGQAIRAVIHDGVPASRVYGLDINDEFIGLGYDLFQDRDRLANQFLIGDILASSADTDPGLNKIRNRMDYIWAGSVIHLFDYETQVRFCKRIIEILFRRKKGNVIFGRQVGHLKPGEMAHHAAVTPTAYRHSETTWRELWGKVALETGTKWKVDVWLDYTETGDWGSTSWAVDAEGARKLGFVVTLE
ncbi:MAG: hypothetical protein M1823_003956 [Watsoniomyces obsoletus]|nr:MAG: hypothetical protein M1823_003956 [Watsoniomyces obsoletus]